MKQILFLLALLTGFVGVSQAQTYTNEDATVTWAFTDHQALGSTNVPTDAFLTTNFSKGSNLNLSTFNTSGCTAGWAGQTMVYIKPTTIVAKNAADASENMLEWTVTPANGITFTPTNVSLTACTAGGTGDPQITIYAVYSDESQETVQERTNPRRPDKTGQGDGPSVYTKELTSAKAGTFKVRAYLAGLTNTSKGMAITNIVVKGTISGTPSASTTYTISTDVSPDAVGTVSGAGTFAEGVTATLTATPNDGYAFVNWTKASDNEWTSTTNPLEVTVTADETYTANFRQLYTVSFSNLSSYLASSMNPLAGPYYGGSNDKFTIPAYAHKYLYSENKTFAGWSDGVNIYQSGDEITLTANTTLTPTFTQTTKTLNNVTEALSMTWNLRYSEILFNSWQGANKQGYYTQLATIGGESVCIPMIIDPTSGKIDNSKRQNNDNAQVNSGTKFTIPAISGMEIVIANAYTAFSSTTVAGATDYTKSNNDKTLTYTYTGNANTIDIVINENNQYLKTIQVTYPVASITQYTTVYDIAASLASNIEGTTGSLAATTADAAANAPELQVDATNGKLGVNNSSWAQINEGTILTLPGVPEGATITFSLYDTTALTINGTAYTNGQTYTATKDENVTMTCTTGGYIKSITVVGSPFVAIEQGYTNTWFFGKSNGAEEFALESTPDYTYTVNGYSIVISTNTTSPRGKLNNASRSDKWAQCNNNTIFKVPVFEGAKLTWESYKTGSTAGFIIDDVLYNSYFVATEEGTVSMMAKGLDYLSYIKIEPVSLYTITGTIDGGDVNGAEILFVATGNGQTYTATITDGAFTLKVPAGTYTPTMSDGVAYVVSTPESVVVSDDANVSVTIVASSPQTVSGVITNAPAEAFTLTFTGGSHTETVNCESGATSFTTTLSPDTYVISSNVGTLSPLSVESFKVVKDAVTHNIYFPEVIPAATQAEITVDKDATVSPNIYNKVSDALAAAKAGNISSPVITLTSGQTYREQVIVDMANVTLKTSGEGKATVTFYYGIGYSYYSLNSSGYYDKDRAMTRNEKLNVGPARWGATVLVTKNGNNFKAENIIFENSFNQYYTNEEVADGVVYNLLGDAKITYDRTLTSGQSGYKAADSKAVTERAAAIAMENNPTGVELYNCEFRGSQDTFYSSGKIYVKNCNIIGNTDYIFGGGYVVFDNCDLTIGGYSDQNASAYITAYKDGTTLDTNKKYVFRDCTVKPSARSYYSANLGRDWGGAASSVYYFNLKNEIGNKLSYSWNNMGGGVSAGTADLHIYDFDPTVNANYNTTGSNGANVNGVLTEAEALPLYANVVTTLGFTPAHIYEDVVELGESSAYNKCRIAASDNVERNVTLARAIGADKWNTIVLPFDMSAEQIATTFGEGTQVAALTNGTAEKLSFATVTTMTANQPYAIKVPAAITAATPKSINGVTIKSATPTQDVDGDWQFVGTYAAGNIPQGSFFFSGNKLWEAEDGTNTIKPFRAWFTYKGAAARSLTFTVDETTGVEEIDRETITNNRYYDLQGRKVVKPTKGLYIVNGRKVVIK